MRDGTYKDNGVDWVFRAEENKERANKRFALKMFRFLRMRIRVMISVPFENVVEIIAFFRGQANCIYFRGFVRKSSTSTR